MTFIDRIPGIYILAFCLTLGVAPVAPEPHVLEKLRMLFQGELVRPIDIFDLFLHGTPWALLLLKAWRTLALRLGRAS